MSGVSSMVPDEVEVLVDRFTRKLSEGAAGPRVCCSRRLEELARSRRSVIAEDGRFRFGERSLPAAVVGHWSAIVVSRLIRRGLFEYVPKARREP